MGSKNRLYVDIMAMNDEVSGSCTLCVAKLPNGESINFIVDCGLFQERKYEYLNYELPFNPENLDFCLVTHNHVDHIGRLPFVVKNGFHKPIYTTTATSKLMPLALEDSFRVLNEVAKRKSFRCLYNENDVDKTLKLIKPCKYEETIYVNKNTKVTFFNNGHLLGASVILVQISFPEYEDINLLFTGDYNSNNIFFDVKPLPEWVLELPITVIQESTYGDMNSDKIHKCFSENVLNCLENEGTVIALVFSLGRSQEISYELKSMQLSGKLNSEIPIYLDGKLAIKYTNLYLNEKLGIKEEMKDFLPENLTYVTKGNRNEILEDTNKKIIITTSGMGSYGPAQVYIPEYIKRKKSLIQFTGYTAEGTLGSRLKNAENNQAVSVGGVVVKKQSKVEYTTEYSAHAKSDEMIAFLNKLKDIKLVLVNHGQASTKQIFTEQVLDKVKTKDIAILDREYLYRVNSYGLVRSLSTKFK